MGLWQFLTGSDNSNNNSLDGLIKLVEKIGILEGQLKQLQMDKDALTKRVDGQAEKMAKLEVDQAELKGQVKQLQKEKAELVKRLEEKQGEPAKPVGKKEQIAEYARGLGVPNVANLKANYNLEKLLLLIQFGNAITQRLYIQRNQWPKQGVEETLLEYMLLDMDNPNNGKIGLIGSIVQLLATTEKPGKMIDEVVIESDQICRFAWPKREELKQKRKNVKVDIKMNEASGIPSAYNGRFMAEYELVNKGSRFQVLIYYHKEDHFDKALDKFIYRRLP